MFGGSLSRRAGVSHAFSYLADSFHVRVEREFPYFAFLDFLGSSMVLFFPQLDVDTVHGRQLATSA